MSPDDVAERVLHVASRGSGGGGRGGEGHSQLAPCHSRRVTTYDV